MHDKLGRYAAKALSHTPLVTFTMRASALFSVTASIYHTCMVTPVIYYNFWALVLHFQACTKYLLFGVSHPLKGSTGTSSMTKVWGFRTSAGPCH